jgi:DNA gyrase/topoisomerase IV subunit A
VIELNSTDIATDDDIRSEMVTWVKLCKATTWEEIRMITKDNPSFESTAESIFISNADKNVVKRCREREDFYLEQEAREKEMAKLKQTIAEKNNTIAEKDALLQKYIEQFGELK